MGQNKEQLELLLQFIEKILLEEGNEWFHDRLAILTAQKTISELDYNVRLAAVTVKQTGKVDKYIENGFIPLIDYSKIVDKQVRFTLDRDCIEMGKWRFSHYDCAPNFLEFCKYAHFQIEHMINYLLLRKFNNDNVKVIQFLRKHNKKLIVKDNALVSQVNFLSKIYALSNYEIIDWDLFNKIKHISWARNEVAHRTPESDKNKSDSSYLKFIDDNNYDEVTFALMQIRDVAIL